MTDCLISFAPGVSLFVHPLDYPEKENLKSSYTSLIPRELKVACFDMQVGTQSGGRGKTRGKRRLEGPQNTGEETQVRSWDS